MRRSDLALLLLAACGPRRPTPETIAGAACVSHRMASELGCVDQFSTRAEIDACRAEVKSRIDCVDGGSHD